MVDSSENDFLEDRLEDLKKFQDQNTKSKIERLKSRYQSAESEKGNPSKETFPDQFKKIQGDFFSLERDFIYRGSLYFLLEKPVHGHIHEPSLIENLFIKSANKFSSLISQLLEDKMLDLQIVYRLCFMYLRIITSTSRLSVSQQMPEFAGIQKRLSPSALYYGETNLKSDLGPKRAYSFFRGLLSSIDGTRDIKLLFFIISKFPVSVKFIDLCLVYLDTCLGKVGRGGKKIDSYKRKGIVSLLSNQEIQQMQFSLKNGLSIAHQEYLNRLQGDLYYMQELNEKLYSLGESEVDPLQTKLIILYWLNLIEFPEKTFKSSASKKIEDFDYFTVSEETLTLSQERFEARAYAYSEKLDSVITIHELALSSKPENEERENYELKETPDEEPVLSLSLSKSLFNFEEKELLRFFKVIDKSMYPSFDVGDFLIIKEVSQFHGYDQNYVIEVFGSLEIRKIIKTGNLEENRGVLSPANQEFKEAEISISDLNIRGIVVGVFKSFEEQKN
tara:strand:- start:102 stop:1610 length:1509 start_codon:yes stop_codon:yes gene_type:complete